MLEPLILHELSYTLPHYVKQMPRGDVAEHLLIVLGWNGVLGQKRVFIEAVERWRDSPGVSFADAYLASLAAEQERPISSKNVRELRGQGSAVPDPLPFG